MSKVDLSDSYTRVWICPEDLLRLAFVVPPHPLDHNTLIGFRLSLLMGHVDSDLYFFCTIKIVTKIANQSWAAIATTTPHLLWALVNTPPATNNYAHDSIIPTELDASITSPLPP